MGRRGSASPGWSQYLFQRRRAAGAVPAPDARSRRPARPRAGTADRRSPDGADRAPCRRSYCLIRSGCTPSTMSCPGTWMQSARLCPAHRAAPPILDRARIVPQFTSHAADLHRRLMQVVVLMPGSGPMDLAHRALRTLFHGIGVGHGSVVPGMHDLKRIQLPSGEGSAVGRRNAHAGMNLRIGMDPPRPSSTTGSASTAPARRRLAPLVRRESIDDKAWTVGFSRRRCTSARSRRAAAPTALGAARVVEHAHPVAEQHRGEEHQDLVEQTSLDALLGDIRAEDVDVPVPGGLLGLGDGGVQVTDERDVGGWLGRWLVGEDEHRPVVLAAERAFAVGAAVGVVAAEGAVAGQDRADAVAAGAPPSGFRRRGGRSARTCRRRGRRCSRRVTPSPNMRTLAMSPG